MLDRDPNKDGQGEIVPGPEPSRPPKGADALAALKGLLAPRPGTVEITAPQQGRRKAGAAMLAECVFLFLAVTLFGPNTQRRINWQQGRR